VLITEVRRTSKGPEIIVSRTHPNLLRRLFEMEVPEIFNGIVEIKAIAREAGSRSKVAVIARQEGVDPVGACVGLRGIRIQNIVNELQGEKIDVTQWSKDPNVFITHALSPAQPLRVDLDVAAGAAAVAVSDRQLSLAIGREGQNARLAAKLTGWKIDIKSSTELEIEQMKRSIEGKVAEQQRVRPFPVPGAVEAVAPFGELVTNGAVPAPATAPTFEPAVAEVALQPVAAAPKPEPEPVAAGATALSVEEQLALESLKLTAPAPARTEPTVEEEEEAEAGEEAIIDEEEIWKVPDAGPGGPQIRFREDILPQRGGGRRGGRRRGGKGQRQGADQDE